jgi:hypothetical protein
LRDRVAGVGFAGRAAPKARRPGAALAPAPPGGDETVSGHHAAGDAGHGRRRGRGRGSSGGASTPAHESLGHPSGGDDSGSSHGRGRDDGAPGTPDDRSGSGSSGKGKHGMPETAAVIVSAPAPADDGAAGTLPAAATPDPAAPAPDAHPPSDSGAASPGDDAPDAPA